MSVRTCKGGQGRECEGRKKIQPPLGVLVLAGRGLLSLSWRAVRRELNKTIHTGPVEFCGRLRIFSTLDVVNWHFTIDSASKNP